MGREEEGGGGREEGGWRGKRKGGRKGGWEEGVGEGGGDGWLGRTEEGGKRRKGREVRKEVKKMEEKGGIDRGMRERKGRTERDGGERK